MEYYIENAGDITYSPNLPRPFGKRINYALCLCFTKQEL